MINYYLSENSDPIFLLSIIDYILFYFIIIIIIFSDIIRYAMEGGEVVPKPRNAKNSKSKGKNNSNSNNLYRHDDSVRDEGGHNIKCREEVTRMG